MAGSPPTLIALCTIRMLSRWLARISEPEAAGLWPHDIIIGFAQDKALPEDQRGHNALISGAAKWAKLNDSSRAKALADLQPSINQGSVTLTVLRAMPFQFIPGDHALKLAFVIPPLCVEFEPNDLTVIAGDFLPTVQVSILVLLRLVPFHLRFFPLHL